MALVMKQQEFALVSRTGSRQTDMEMLAQGAIVAIDQPEQQLPALASLRVSVKALAAVLQATGANAKRVEVVPTVH
jgi:hypothetical protein